jgi:hypothetical protein
VWAAWTHDPDSVTRSFGRRPDDFLPFDITALPRDAPLMLDTNVYIARATDRLPAAIIALVARRTVLHCGVALAELAITAGLLDPADPRTAATRDRLEDLLASIGLADCRSPSSVAWAEAGMLSGILARTQLGLAAPRSGLSSTEICCQTGKRREILSDALLFLAAGEAGAILVSANVSDMDLLLRFRPDINVLLYRQTASRQQR